MDMRFMNKALKSHLLFKIQIATAGEAPGETARLPQDGLELRSGARV